MSKPLSGKVALVTGGSRGLGTAVAAAQATFGYSVEPIKVLSEGNRVTATSNVVGNFPGSPVMLNHSFGLIGDKINTLEILYK